MRRYRRMVWRADPGLLNGRRAMRLISIATALVRAAFADGPLPGLARLLLAGLYAVTLTGSAGGSDPAAQIGFVLIMLAIVGYIVEDWRFLMLALFAPDRPLWRVPANLSWPRRLCLAACLHLLFAVVTLGAVAAVLSWGAWFLPLPLAASLLQAGLRRLQRRLAESSVAGCDTRTGVRSRRPRCD